MTKPRVGIIEGFFGPEWSWKSRAEICDFLKATQSDFYIYAPKRDSYLRKNWKLDHPSDQWSELKSLSAQCSKNKIQFGLGLSPFEIHDEWNESSKKILREKILKLEDLGIDFLGLFFDDMRGSPDLAEKQCEIIEFSKSVTNLELLFCPTYYSKDPILERVFGPKPEFYLETLGENISQDVQILWTGNKVIPSLITADELEAVSKIIRRKPFLWENYFANDGPKQCKFLKLKPFEGRSTEALNQTSGWAFNPMNQPHLSMLVYQASLLNLRNNLEPRNAFEKALTDLAGMETSQALLRHQKSLLEVGLDSLDEKTRAQIRNDFKAPNSYAHDVVDWLDGHYLVGSECLTD